MITITKRLEFDAGHRLLKHESKCRNVHGHRYVFDFTIGFGEDGKLDAVGRIIDFSEVKRVLASWIDTHFDHAMIVQEGDPLIAWLSCEGLKHYVVPFSPTAENLVGFMASIARSLIPTCTVLEVVCHETPTSSATWSVRG